MLPIQFFELRFEIIIHQRDRQIGRAVDNANAKPAQGGSELFRALDVDRPEAHPAFVKVLPDYIGSEAEICPISSSRIRCSACLADQVAALDQSANGLPDLIGREFS